MGHLPHFVLFCPPLRTKQPLPLQKYWSHQISLLKRSHSSTTWCCKFLCVAGLKDRLSNFSRGSANFMSHDGWQNLARSWFLSFKPGSNGFRYLLMMLLFSRCSIWLPLVVSDIFRFVKVIAPSGCLRNRFSFEFFRKWKTTFLR